MYMIDNVMVICENLLNVGVKIGQRGFFFFSMIFESECFFFNSCLNLSFSNGIWIGWIFDEVVMFHILVH